MTRRRSSRDYHDYIFRDGKLIGDWDGMYRHSEKVPWEQDKRADHWYTEVGITMLKTKAPFRCILDVGCGLGYVADKLRCLGGVVEGFDVSEVAVDKARRTHPAVTFFVDDITRESFKPRKKYDLVVAKDIFWYVFQDLQVALTNLCKSVKMGGYLYVCQSFPSLDKPFVGRDVLDSPETLVARLEADFDPVYTLFLRRHEHDLDGPMLHFVGRKRKRPGSSVESTTQKRRARPARGRKGIAA